MTVKDQTGKQVFFKQREYTSYNLYFEGGKQVPLAEWDITAMEIFDTRPYGGQIDSNTYIVELTEGTKSVDVEASYNYEYEPGNTVTVQKVTQKVEFK